MALQPYLRTQSPRRSTCTGGRSSIPKGQALTRKNRDGRRRSPMRHDLCSRAAKKQLRSCVSRAAGPSDLPALRSRPPPTRRLGVPHDQCAGRNRSNRQTQVTPVVHARAHEWPSDAPPVLGHGPTSCAPTLTQAGIATQAAAKERPPPPPNPPSRRPRHSRLPALRVGLPLPQEAKAPGGGPRARRAPLGTPLSLILGHTCCMRAPAKAVASNPTHPQAREPPAFPSPRLCPSPLAARRPSGRP